MRVESGNGSLFALAKQKMLHKNKETQIHCELNVYPELSLPVFMSYSIVLIRSTDTPAGSVSPGPVPEFEREKTMGCFFLNLGSSLGSVLGLNTQITEC